MLRLYRISGRVQRVGFRAATRRQAEGLGLCGHARNLPDGDVEVLACGEETAVAQLHDWLQRGPIWARVDRVVELDAPRDARPTEFSTG